MEQTLGHHGFEVFASGGQAGLVAYELDWALHPLGEPACWSCDLQTTLRIVLGAPPVAMALFWGEAGFVFYNDAYAQALGTHKKSSGLDFGQPLVAPGSHESPGFVREEEIAWVRASAQALSVSRNLGKHLPKVSRATRVRPEDCEAWGSWCVRYSPVMADDGAVAGVLAICSSQALSPAEAGGVGADGPEKEVVFVRDYPKPEAQASLSYVSPSHELLGQKKVETLYQDAHSLLESIHLEDRARIVASHEWHARGEATDLDGRITWDDGSQLLLRDRSFPLPQPGGGEGYQLTGWVEDVTLQRATEERLQQASELSALFLQNVPVGVAMFDTEMRYLLVSDRWLQDFGLTGQNLIGRSHYEVFPCLPEHWKALHRRCLEQGVSERCECDSFLSPGGLMQYLRWEVRPWWVTKGGRVGGLVFFSEDLTARQAEEEKFRLLAELSPQHLWMVNEQGENTFCNRQLLDFLGLSQATNVLESWSARVHPVDLPQVWAAWEQARLTQAPYESECRVRAGSGEYLWFLNHGVFLQRSEHQQACGSSWIGVSVDVSSVKRVEEALRESERLQTLLAANMLQGVVFYDPALQALSMNPAAEAILGTQDLAGLSDRLRGEKTVSPNLREDGTLFPDDEHPVSVALQTGITQKRVVIAVYNPLQKAYRLLEMDACPLTLTEGKKKEGGVVSIFSDITDRKDIENDFKQASEILKAITEASTDLIFVKNRYAKLVYGNPAYFVFIGRKEEQFYGKSAAEYYPGQEGEVITENDARVLNSGRGELLAERVTSPEGLTRIYWANKQVRRDFLGRVVGLTGISRDITELTLMRERLERSEKRLQQLVEHLQAVNQRKNSFLAHLSHEIRTPLTVMLGFTELLKEPDLTRADREHFVGIVAKNCQWLKLLVSDALDLSKLEAGFLLLKKEDCNWQQLIAEVMDLFQRQAAEKNLTLTATATTDDGGATHPLSSTRVYTDPKRFKQIMTHLISNAVKFTPLKDLSSSRGISIDSQLVPEARGTVLEIRVCDCGVGLSEREAAQLFQVLLPESPSSHRHSLGGNGLGLFLSRQLAESLGGQLVLESTAEGKGSTFLLRLQSPQG